MSVPGQEDVSQLTPDTARAILAKIRLGEQPIFAYKRDPYIRCIWVGNDRVVTYGEETLGQLITYIPNDKNFYTDPEWQGRVPFPTDSFRYPHLTKYVFEALEEYIKRFK